VSETLSALPSGVFISPKEREALDRLLEMNATGQIDVPDWAWKEIVRYTPLRLDTDDPGWEFLTKDEVTLRNAQDKATNNWRIVLNAWENENSTGWRVKHRASLELVVIRAVCNEVSEHIHHLRGLAPGGGLTARPDWYLQMTKDDPVNSFFRRPMSAADLNRPGASILFLGWVRTQPNPWQIARPLPGISFTIGDGGPAIGARRSVPVDGQTYAQEGSAFIRRGTRASLARKGHKPPAVAPTEWLRWTHEAVVVGVEEMALGNFVITFETGQIGLNVRSLSSLVNTWSVFVGYTPQAANLPLSPAMLAMIDRKKVLPNPP
jgi:hypothetical protein